MKMENIKLNSEAWVKLSDYQIIDPDGWDRSHPDKFNADWNKEITFDEFLEKAHRSTTYLKRVSDDELKIMVFDKILQGQTH